MQGTRVNRNHHNTAMRDIGSRRTTGQGYVINNDLSPVDEDPRREAGK